MDEFARIPDYASRGTSKIIRVLTSDLVPLMNRIFDEPATRLFAEAIKRYDIKPVERPDVSRFVAPHDSYQSAVEMYVIDGTTFVKLTPDTRNGFMALENRINALIEERNELRPLDYQRP